MMTSRLRMTLLVGMVLGLWGVDADRAAQAAGRVISNTEASRLGLKRAWYTQVRLDRARDRVAQLVLHKRTLLVLTDRSLLHVLDAETGQRQWTAQIGQSGAPSLELGVSDKYVAVVNGSTLYVVDRADGRPVWDVELNGAPGAGPAIAGEYVYVPLMRSRIEAYDLRAPDHSSWLYGTVGQTFVQPLVTPVGVCWPTEGGRFYVGWANAPGIRFQLETGGNVITQPVYQKPYFYLASDNGFVYAIHEETGKRQWRFSSGTSIRTPMALFRPHDGEGIDGRIYVCPNRGGMFCIEELSGRELWWAPKVARPVAVTPGHVYAADRLGQLHILDAKTGAGLGLLKMEATSLYLSNQQTDRIYVVSETGLIHCLHETDLDSPIQYDQRASEELADETSGEAQPSEEALDEVPREPVEFRP